MVVARDMNPGASLGSKLAARGRLSSLRPRLKSAKRRCVAPGAAWVATTVATQALSICKKVTAAPAPMRALGQGVAQEVELPGIGFAGQPGRVSVESVNSFGIDRNLGPIACRSPALGHEERIVDQAVHGADCE